VANGCKQNLNLKFLIDEPIGCGNSATASIFFFSYTFIISTVFLRLFIAIILQTFKLATDRENKFMNTHLSEHFRDIWARFDPDATSFIKKSVYSQFLIALADPMGWDITYKCNFMR
jgi:hypothetical protein